MTKVKQKTSVEQQNNFWLQKPIYELQVQSRNNDFELLPAYSSNEKCVTEINKNWQLL